MLAWQPFTAGVGVCINYPSVSVLGSEWQVVMTLWFPLTAHNMWFCVRADFCRGGIKHAWTASEQVKAPLLHLHVCTMVKCINLWNTKETWGLCSEPSDWSSCLFPFTGWTVVLTPSGFPRRKSSEINSKREHLCLWDPSDILEHGTDRSQKRDSRKDYQNKTKQMKKRKKKKNIISM